MYRSLNILEWNTMILPRVTNVLDVTVCNNWLCLWYIKCMINIAILNVAPGKDLAGTMWVPTCNVKRLAGQ